MAYVRAVFYCVTSLSQLRSPIASDVITFSLKEPVMFDLNNFHILSLNDPVMFDLNNFHVHTLGNFITSVMLVVERR